MGLWCEHRPAEEDDKERADMLALGMYERAFPEYVDQARDMSSLSSVIGSRLIRLIKEPVEYDPAKVGRLACLIFRNEACPMYPDMFQTRF